MGMTCVAAVLIACLYCLSARLAWAAENGLRWKDKDVAWAIVAHDGGKLDHRLNNLMEIWWRPSMRGNLIVDGLNPNDVARLEQSQPGLQISILEAPDALKDLQGSEQELAWRLVCGTYESFPDAKWYILAEDDTVFVVDNLLMILEDRSPNDLVMMGSVWDDQKMMRIASGSNETIDPYTALLLPPGVVISQALMAQLAARLEATLAADTDPKASAGYRIWKLGVEIMGSDAEYVPGMHMVPPKFGEYELTRLLEAHPKHPLVSMHNMDMDEIIKPMLAQGHTLATLKAAMTADGPSYAQETVCKFQRLGLFAIATGFDVRWWDEPDAAAEGATSFHPLHDGLPHDKFIMASTVAVPKHEARGAGAAAVAEARAWTYSRMPHSLGAHHQRWRSVRVMAPVLPPQKWLAVRGRALLCCASASERPHFAEVHIHLKECPEPAHH